MRSVTAVLRRPTPLALGGIAFAAFFVAGNVAAGVLASDSLPLPGAPAAEVARYYAGNQTATVVSGVFQMLSALSLLAFVAAIGAVVRRAAGERGNLPRLLAGGGYLAAASLLVSALLALTLAGIATGADAALVGTVRDWNFRTGGVIHVVALGLFVGAASLTAARAEALPRGIRWLGYVTAVPAIASVLSVLVFPATILLPVGRLLGFAWSIAAGIALLVGTARTPQAAGR